MNILESEASWSLKKINSEKLITADDTAVICQSWNQLDRYLDHLKKSFPKNTLHAVAIKTNPHKEVLKHIVQLGFGLEAASFEEVQIAAQTGISYDKIVFDSPVKTKKEIAFCHEHFPGIKLNVNCIEELQRIPENPSFTLGVRINPMINSGSPELYHVSSNESKFGVPISERDKLLEAIVKFPITQLHIHAGSHMTKLNSAILAIQKLVSLAEEANNLLAQNGIKRRIKFLDIGGGLPPEKIKTEKTSKMQKYALKMTELLPNLKNYQLITEFGQWCYFYTGYAFSKIEYVVKRGEKRVIFIHLGADYLMRDTYSKPRGIIFKTYNSFGEKKNTELQSYDIAGPLCFAGDYLMKEQQLNLIGEGDWLALLNTGSNSLGLWSRHCSRTIPKIFGVDFEQKKINLLSNRQKID